MTTYAAGQLFTEQTPLGTSAIRIVSVGAKLYTFEVGSIQNGEFRRFCTRRGQRFRLECFLAGKAPHPAPSDPVVGTMAHDDAWTQTDTGRNDDPDTYDCQRCGDTGEFVAAWGDDPDQREVCDCSAGDELWDHAAA